MNEKPKIANAEGENENNGVDDTQKPNQQQQPAGTKVPAVTTLNPQQQTETQPDNNNNNNNNIEPEITQANADKKKTEKMFAELATVFDGNMYIANDTCIGHIKEKIKYMFPTDNGIFIKKVIENGRFSSFSSFVYKDDMIFGIRKNDDQSKEFWYHYPDDTSLNINYINNETFTNFSLPNGLNIQILPHGEIAQKLIGDNEHRIINSKATVIKCYEDGKRRILYSNGNVCEIKNNKAINTNNRGNCVEKDLTTGEITPLKPIPITVQTDTESQCKTLIREDGVLNLKYPNNTSLTIHEDTTKIYTYAKDDNDNVHYLIEHNDFATVNVYVSGDKREYEGDVLLTELARKSIDGIVYVVILPNKNKVYIVKEKVEGDKSKVSVFIYNFDGGIFKVEDGDVEIISPTERRKFEQLNELKEQLEGDVTMRKEGVYTCDLKEGKIFTVDGEHNVFEIYDDGYANCVLSKKDEEGIKEGNEGEESGVVEKEESVQKQSGVEGSQQQQQQQEGTENVKLQRPKSPDYELLAQQEEEERLRLIKEKEKEKLEELQNNQQQQQQQAQTQIVGSNNRPNITTGIVNNNANTANKTTKINPTTKTTTQQQQQPQEDEQQQDNTDQPQEEQQEEPPVTNFITPRLFVIESDSSGYELLTEAQVISYKLLKDKDTLHVKYFKEQLTTDYNAHYWITKYYSVAEGIQETHLINMIQIPQTLEKFAKLPQQPIITQKEIYYYRNLIESQSFSNEFREKVAKAKDDSYQYFEKKKTEWFFGTYLDKTAFKDDIAQRRMITKQILEKRQVPDVKFDYDKIRKKININNGFIQILPNESVLFNIQEYVDMKEAKKIREDLSFRIYPLNLQLVAPSEMRTIVSEFDNKTDALSNSIINRKKTMIESNTKEVKFFRNYFDSDKGVQFLKDHPHQSYVKQTNQDPQEQLAQTLLEKGAEEMEEEKVETAGNIGLEGNIDINNKQNSPVVYLNEDNQGMHSGNISNQHLFAGSTKSLKKPKILPSIHKKTQILNQLKEEYNAQKAREWQDLKTMKYTYDGALRNVNPKVPHYLKPTFPQAEFNEDYIYIEKLTERRVKTSSVANRIYFNAPSVEEIRKSGQHDFLIEAMENRRTPEEMMERMNLMMTAELCDPLNKQLKIDPVCLDFGIVSENRMYQMYFRLRNDDNMTNRVQIRKINESPNILIENFIGGKVVFGETKKVKIVLNTKDLIGKFSDIIEVQTKSFLYKIPIKALVVKEDEFDKAKFTKEGREVYIKSYPAGDSKFKCDPVKLVLPKIRELEDAERTKKMLERQKEANMNMTGGNEESEIYNNDGSQLPKV